jgi:hypothetical protein
MILRNFRDKTKSGCLTQIMYKNSRFDKFIYIIRGLLNKMTNEDNRNFNQSIA